MKSAVALKYDPEQHPAPVVIAKGKGKFAQKILEIARKHNIPIAEENQLAEELYQLEIDCAIPEAFYEIVAEILAFVYQKNQSFPRTMV